METKRIIGVLLAVVLTASMASAAITRTNQNMLWEGVVVNTDADTLAYNGASADYTWTLNEKDGVPADVTWGDVADTLGRCYLGYSSSASVTQSLTIQTTVGAPGVINYIGDLNYSIRLGHTNDTGIVNIESGNTLLVDRMWKYRNTTDPTQSPTPDKAIVNINDGHVFSYGIPDPLVERTMHGITVNIATGSSLRIMGDIATVYDQATYAAYTTSTTATGADGYAGSVNALGGAVLQFTDGGIYEGNPTVLITAVPEPATMLLLGLGSLGMLWKKR